MVTIKKKPKQLYPILADEILNDQPRKKKKTTCVNTKNISQTCARQVQEIFSSFIITMKVSDESYSGTKIINNNDGVPINNNTDIMEKVLITQ